MKPIEQSLAGVDCSFEARSGSPVVLIEVVGSELDEGSTVGVACQYPAGHGDSHCLISGDTLRLATGWTDSWGGGTQEPSVGQPVCADVLEAAS